MYFFVCDPIYRPKILIPDLGAVIPDLIYFITTLNLFFTSRGEEAQKKRILLRSVELNCNFQRSGVVLGEGEGEGVNQKPLYLCEAYGYFLGAYNSYDDDE